MYTNKLASQNVSVLAIQLLCLLAVLFSSASVAQSENSQIEQPEDVVADFFRIELILYKVLDGNGNAKLSNSISDYTDPILMHELLLDAEEKAVTETETETETEKETDSLGPSITDITEIEISQSEVMENAWKRLRGSRSFRPLMYTQWNELRAGTVARHAPGGVEGNAVRVHGESILAEAQAHRSGIPPITIISADGLGELIEIEPTYKLDGKASFGQGRFLHINLDFEYRNRSADDFSHGLEQQPSMTAEETAEQALVYKIYSLKKTRQIVPLKPELFDNEQFGVLVYLEEISPVDMANSTDLSPLDENKNTTQ